MPRSQQRQRREVDQQYRAANGQHLDRVAVAADDARQQPMTGGDEDGQQADDGNDTGAGRDDIGAGAGAQQLVPVIAPIQQRITNHEQRQSPLPENIEPGAALWAASKQPAARKQAGKGQPLRNDDQRSEEIPVCQDERRPQSRSSEPE
jgi:hypothetical protein